MSDAYAPTEADLVWNRAAGQAGEGIGDKHLGALLLLHGMVMNGGPEHAADSLETADVEAAAAGAEYLDLGELAAVVREIPGAAEDEDENERLNDAYLALVPDDGVLVQAFEARYRTSPGDFAPVR